jgi:hypothetical protein
MTNSWRRILLASGVALATAAGSLAVTGPAGAQPVDSGSVSFSGDAGDYITGGGSYAYSIDDGDQLTVSSSNGTNVNVSISGANGDWWWVTFDAPMQDVLAPGTYTEATRYPFNGAGAGLSLAGNGRGCNTLTGSFTVTEASFGPQGYVETFAASFEQHCEGGTAAARGEVRISNPPPPLELSVGLDIDGSGTVSRVSGAATVDGTVTCNKPTTETITGSVTQVVRATVVRGAFSTQVSCTPGDPVPWTATADPDGSTPFRSGDVDVDAKATGQDDDYGGFVSAVDTAVVRLRPPGRS